MLKRYRGDLCEKLIEYHDTNRIFPKELSGNIIEITAY